MQLRQGFAEDHGGPMGVEEAPWSESNRKNKGRKLSGVRFQAEKTLPGGHLANRRSRKTSGLVFRQAPKRGPMGATEVANFETLLNELTSVRFGVEDGAMSRHTSGKSPGIESATNRVKNKSLGLKLCPVRSRSRRRQSWTVPRQPQGHF